MYIIADVNKISKTVERNLTFILNVLSESSIHFTSFQWFLLKRMLVFSHKMFFIKNVTVCNYAGTCKGICSYNLVYNVLMQLFPLKSLVFVVHFLNAFWHGKETFPKSSSQNEIVPLLIVFHLPYSKYEDVKICFYSCRYQHQNFSLVSHSCSSCSTRTVLGSLVQHSCRSCLALVL